MAETEQTPIKRSVLDYNDIAGMVPALKGKEKLVNRLLKMLSVDKVNWLHDNNCDTHGATFVRGVLNDLKIKVRIDNEHILDEMGNVPLITV